MDSVPKLLQKRNSFSALFWGFFASPGFTAILKGMSTLSSPPTPTRAKKSRGQSLVEVALFLPLLLMMLGGLIEFGFALNQYLNALDAAREAARYSSDGDPGIRAFCYDGDNDDLLDDANVAPNLAIDDGCPGGQAQQNAYQDDEILDKFPDPNQPISIYKGTADFYAQAAYIALQTIKPVPLDPARDDVVISVFRILSGTVVGRWPNCEPDGAEDCPRDPPTYTETLGEWHLFGFGTDEACADGDDDDSDGVPDDGCDGGPPQVGPTVDWSCNRSATLAPLCHPSLIGIDDVENVLRPDAPNSAAIAVEIFYSYNQVLKLPWITPFVPDPIQMHTYTIAPVPAAEPSLTISGTITDTLSNPDVLLSGVTVEFVLNGQIIGEAITDVNGEYVKGGLNSGAYTLTARRPGTTCSFTALFTNPVVVTIADSPGNDFTASCPTPTPAPTPTVTDTPTSTPDVTETPTETPEPGATPTPTNTPVCPDPSMPVDPALSAFTTVSTSVDADGVETTDLVVTVRNACGIMASQPVTITSSRAGGVDVISPATGATNGSGQFFSTVKSSLSSPWDDTTGVFTPTTLTAQAGAGALIGTITDQPTVQFLCANGIPAGFSSASDIQYYFINETAEDRSLERVTLTWPSAGSANLNSIAVFPPTFNVWSGSIPPAVAVVNGWTGTPSDRTILSVASNGSLFLALTFSVDLTTLPGSPNNPFLIQTQWKNEADGRICTSDEITILR